MGASKIGVKVGRGVPLSMMIFGVFVGLAYTSSYGWGELVLAGIEFPVLVFDRAAVGGAIGGGGFVTGKLHANIVIAKRKIRKNQALVRVIDKLIN